MTPHAHNPSPDRLTHTCNAKCEKLVIGVSPNDLNHWTTFQFLNLSNPVCLFGLRISGVSPQALQRLSTLSQTFIARFICLTKNKFWVFHSGWGGICPILLHPNTRDLLLLLFYTTMSLDFGRCPISELTIHSPRMVNNSTMHPHPTRRNVTVNMKCMMPMHFPSCYMYI